MAECKLDAARVTRSGMWSSTRVCDNVPDDVEGPKCALG